jgi:hypothetical protein
MLLFTMPIIRGISLGSTARMCTSSSTCCVAVSISACGSDWLTCAYATPPHVSSVEQTRIRNSVFMCRGLAECVNAILDLIVLLRSVSAALTHVVVMPAMGRGISRGRALRFPFSLQPRRGPALSNDASARMRRSPNKLLRCRSRRIGSERG